MESTTTDIVYSCASLELKRRPQERRMNPHRYLLFMSDKEMMEYFNNKEKDDDDEIFG